MALKHPLKCEIDFHFKLPKRQQTTVYVEVTDFNNISSTSQLESLLKNELQFFIVRLSVLMHVCTYCNVHEWERERKKEGRVIIVVR